MNIVPVSKVLMLVVWIPPLKTRSSPATGATFPDQLKAFVQKLLRREGLGLMLAPVQVRVATGARVAASKKIDAVSAKRACPVIGSLAVFYRGRRENRKRIQHRK